MMNMQEIAEQLERTGYLVLAQPLHGDLSARLLARCQNDAPGRFQAAQVGRGLAKRRIDALRGDLISWLDEANSTDCAYLAWMEELRSGLNAALYLGLFDYECHYAIYGAGGSYAKHSDVLNGSRNRMLSTVLYLNEGWQAGDGGELRLFAPDGEAVIATVSPTFGKMVIFLSESFPHEVLAAHKERRSLTGWFRGRAIG
jgi:SM-20-related protein